MLYRGLSLSRHTGERGPTEPVVLVEAYMPRDFKLHIEELVQATALIKGAWAGTQPRAVTECALSYYFYYTSPSLALALTLEV